MRSFDSLSEQEVLRHRVLIAEQNPSALSQGALPFVDAFYDIRHPFNSSTGSFSISGYTGKLPVTIQNMPEEQIGAVYGEGDGSFINLPPRQRDLIRQAIAEQMPPEYASLIRQYYINVARGRPANAPLR